MYKAYIRTDNYENPEVLNDLLKNLKEHEITPILTLNRYEELADREPVLYYRNAYVRFPHPKEILKFHQEHPNFSKIFTNDFETISVNPSSKSYPFHLKEVQTSYFKPNIEKLPILFVTHKRPEYFQLMINSVVYNTEPDQKFYIVGSAPDEKTINIIRKFLEDHPTAEAVISKENLGYSVNNFGPKFFGIKEFIEFEDDFILPESTNYLYPYWVQQFHYRLTYADNVCFRTSLENCHTRVLQSYPLDKKFVETDDKPWHYYFPEQDDRPPISANGLYINSYKLYGEDIPPPKYFHGDKRIFWNAKQICLANLSGYHIGSNQNMDGNFGDYLDRNKRCPNPERYQIGKNVKTGEEKTIDLKMGHKEWFKLNNL